MNAAALKVGRGEVNDPGCSQCKATYAYPVLAGEDVVGRVWQHRPDHDGDHWGADWRAALADGTPVTGGWSSHRGGDGLDFCSRNWALTRLRATLHQRLNVPAESTRT